MIKPIATAMLLLLAACSGSSDPNATADADTLPPANALPPPDIEEVPPSETELVGGSGERARPTDDWVGRWVGVEGLVLNVAARPDGDYDLAMTWSLDDSGTFVGRPDGDSIVFERGGETRRLRAGTGADTGLKWLADKRDCLYVEPGEGYCRD
ncbi:hypothetical protein GGR88_001232 [Sphingomonas jejuensis]|uniref:Lipoprotein n=1 Tax=Sphingomonas jejuensis TaxID=904715 RepID=A0ABX0XKS4_9SPHN|nr:hypothetical protein [Sphingomonas jejuensis]NJC33758.1 hypothetical protein [Sphingomonas jejuensis]